jgi:DsbC/DsbD-like thiol-disulfide interchange protein
MTGKLRERMTLTSIGLLLAVALRAAQGDSPASVIPTGQSTVVETPHLQVRTTGGEAGAAPGGRVSLFVEVVPKPRMHVYAPEQKAYLPVSLRMEPSPYVKVRPAVFPKGESFFFAPTRETQIVYSRPFRIELPVTIGRVRPAGPLTLTGTLEYQACDDRLCYAPRKVPVTWVLHLQ